MKIVLQRVSAASVTVDQETVGSIDEGLLLLVGFGKNQDIELISRMRKASEKIVNLRVFSNSLGKLDKSVLDLGGEILAVPQFTLYGKAQKGRRPDFADAMEANAAQDNFGTFCAILGDALGKPLATGQFGADMKVSLLNNGPLTLILEF